MKTNLLTFWSESHKGLFDEVFLPSFDRHLRKSFRLKAVELPQHAAEGLNRADGWQKQMGSKCEAIVKAATDWSEPFVCADCDIAFRGDFRDDIIGRLDGKDILYQNNFKRWKPYCCGFFAMRPAHGPIDLYMRAADMLGSVSVDCEQTAVNLLLTGDPGLARTGELPNDIYWSPGGLLKCKAWDGQQDITPPSTAMVVHATWVSGVEAKLQYLKGIA